MGGKTLHHVYLDRNQIGFQSVKDTYLGLAELGNNRRCTSGSEVAFDNAQVLQRRGSYFSYLCPLPFM